MRLIRFYGGRRYFGVTVRNKFDLTAIATLMWFERNWWCWEYVAGVLIVRAGPFTLTVWEPKLCRKMSGCTRNST